MDYDHQTLHREIMHDLCAIDPVTANKVLDKCTAKAISSGWCRGIELLLACGMYVESRKYQYRWPGSKIGCGFRHQRAAAYVDETDTRAFNFYTGISLIAATKSSEQILRSTLGNNASEVVHSNWSCLSFLPRSIRATSSWVETTILW
ncbi:hypothetical protein N7509_003709 [Penicillium cosmopolitanum]|uniref:Uncharacterized protein n=1 Tax=Penicillium cosmopolitanum TaxID=1131564 RepID=A0A9W9W5V7_9EURO|nr:uncharacterized protein N7509_003709 [Penicillium cosmopolitanum]KAJ5403838.1 hypothetical protein N7509_003709 [Penicillium cosmopolitanum]